MPMSTTEAAEAVRQVWDVRSREQTRLNLIRDYLRGKPDPLLRSVLNGMPSEVRTLAKIARVNMIGLVVNNRVQSMYVDGFRDPASGTDARAWDVWQANKFDARQIGVHRAALAYGASYVTVMPGDPVPVLRGVSPRKLTATYGDDDTWPLFALEQRNEGWRLIDNEAVYRFAGDPDAVAPGDIGIELHDAGVTPVIRYRDTDDLDDPVLGLVEPLMPVQDQVNLITFGLLVVVQFAAFKQRAVIGWLAESEEEKLKASASRLWTFQDPDIKVEQLDETDPAGYVGSREATIRLLATISQTPVHELLGQLVNLSAEALTAAEASHRRAVTENQTVVGEAHEQMLNLVDSMMGGSASEGAMVRWRDTESRSLGMLVDALGKAVTMLGIPQQALWEQVADALGASQQQVEEWRQLAPEPSGSLLGPDGNPIAA